jgi:hypothetical protein
MTRPSTNRVWTTRTVTVPAGAAAGADAVAEVGAKLAARPRTAQPSRVKTSETKLTNKTSRRVRRRM